MKILASLVQDIKEYFYIEYVQVNVTVVCGYLSECFGDFGRGEEGIKVYGIYTG